MANINDNNHVTVQGWMRTRLNLDGINLLVFAIVWSFSQDGESEFRGSIDYIKDFIGKSRDTAMRSLKALEDSKLVKKIDHNTDDGKTNGYVVDIEVVNALLTGVGGIANCDTPHSKLPYGVSQNATGGIANCDPINKSISNSITKNIEERKKEYIEESNIDNLQNLVQMSDEELLDYSDKMNSLPMEEFDYYAWKALDAELKRRAEKRRFIGKIVVGENGRIERLKSYDEVMEGLSEKVRAALFAFIRHCSVNKHIVTNAKLEDLIMRLEEYPEDDDKVAALNEAINMGYFDIRLKTTLLKQQLLND